MIGRLYALIVTVVCLFSAGLTYQSVATVAANPALRPVIERSQDEIIAATDRLIAREASQQRLDALLTRRLEDEPRNWVALVALAELYQERGLTLPSDYLVAKAEDSGFLAETRDCASCIWDSSTCSLTKAVLCKTPVMLTPVDDLRGLLKAGVDHLIGNEVDYLDAGLSAVGLSATALIVVSGGTSATVKTGTTLVRLARDMKLLSPRLVDSFTAALRDGVRWSDIRRYIFDDPSQLLRKDVLAPVGAVISDLGRTKDAIGLEATLHLLPLVDDATDARSLARVSEALGSRTVSRAELLGKSKLFRATLRFSDTAAEMLIGFVGIFASIGAALSHLIQTLALQVRPSRRRPAQL